MATPTDDAVVPGYSFPRSVRRRLQKLKLAVRAYGVRYGLQQARELKKLQTFHPGERGEYDYTKFAVLLFPHKNWPAPLLFFVGIGVDHASTVIKGFTITAQPTAVSGIRLYKNCTLPGPLWLPKHLVEKYGHEADVCGFDRIIAIDNGRDLQSDAVTSLFLLIGAIILCIPPKRGDLKGTVERTIRSLEQMFFEALDGYVPNVKKFLDPANKYVRDEAYKKAKLTIAEFEELLLLAVLAYNRQNHPTYKRPRISIYREGLEQAPPVLPVGRLQIDAIFSMKYTGPVTREGVQAETWHYNSPELQEFCRVGGETVEVSVPVDDVRTAIVRHPELIEPMLVPMTTHPFTDPTPMEMAKTVIDKGGDATYRVPPDGEGHSSTDRFFNRLDELQRGSGRVKGTKAHTATTAAAQAAAIPPVAPPKARPVDDVALAKLFGEAETEEQ